MILREEYCFSVQMKFSQLAIGWSGLKDDEMTDYFGSTNLL